MMERQIIAAVDRELDLGAKRSPVYRAGMLAAFRARYAVSAVSNFWPPGTVEFDAYYSGVERGHVLFQRLASTCALKSDNGVLISQYPRHRSVA
jgi:hypothetical protein